MSTPSRRWFGLQGERAILVASTGGHLAQLLRLRRRLDIASDPLWVTFDHPQSRSLLADERTLFVPYIAPRDYVGVIRGFRQLYRALSDEPYDCMISTGAAIALSALPVARLAGRRAIYLESIARFDGPSLSGRMLRMLRCAELYTQYESWAAPPWQFAGSLLEGYEVRSRGSLLDRPLRVFVTLGTIKPYRFDRMVDAVRNALPHDADVVWQLGATRREDLPGATLELTDDRRFQELIEWADVVVTHAGVGTVLLTLSAGKVPVVAARDGALGEHVDSHQRQLVEYLREFGLAVAPALTELSGDHLRLAAGRIVRSETRD